MKLFVKVLKLLSFRKIDIFIVISAVILIVATLLENFLWNRLLFYYPLGWISLILLYGVLIIWGFVRSTNRLKHFIFYGILTLTILCAHIFSIEWFRSPPILIARLDSDLNHLTLVLRENGGCHLQWIGMLGISGEYDGKYIIQDDKLIFLKRPYDNAFIPDTLYFAADKIVFRYTETGEPDESFASYFTISWRK